jgi:hypothetical protein
VLGFSFYDMWAYLQILGPNEAWRRLAELLAWEKEVWAEGGYRPYYEGGKRGTTLQGGGTAGGLGIDHEFWESSLVPSIVVHGFLGLDPTATHLVVRPRLPKACPQMGVSNVLYRGVRLDIRCGQRTIEICMKDQPDDPIRIDLEGQLQHVPAKKAVSDVVLDAPGIYRFER